jgi:hypothetical protein
VVAVPAAPAEPERAGTSVAAVLVAVFVVNFVPVVVPVLVPVLVPVFAPVLLEPPVDADRAPAWLPRPRSERDLGGT